jgi:hypothetical protein
MGWATFWAIFFHKLIQSPCLWHKKVERPQVFVKYFLN